MAYKKANRHLTDQQFSKGTTIDGSRIDDAIEDIIEAHNDIPIGDVEAQWTPNTITLNWTPSKSSLRFTELNVIQTPNTTRYGVNQTDAKCSDWFPFMVSQNAASEVFPAADQPPTGFQNQFRSKGYYYEGAADAEDELLGRIKFSSVDDAEDPEVSELWYQQAQSVASWDGDVIASPVGNGGTPLQRRFFTLDIPLYFNNPIIITNVSVFAASEHPLGAYNSFIGVAGLPHTHFGINADGYKDTSVGAYSTSQPSYDAYMPNRGISNAEFEKNTESVNNASVVDLLPATSGVELPGELYTITQRNAGDMTVQISLDNDNLPENKSINKIIFTKTQLGDAVCRFNRLRTTTNRGNSAGGGGGDYGENNGAEFEDMEPQFAGGSTWGVWLKEDGLNIPVPRDSRLHYQIIVKGFRPHQLFDWHIAISYMELLDNE